MEVPVRIGSSRKHSQSLVCIRRGVLHAASRISVRDGQAAAASASMTQLGNYMAAAVKHPLPEHAAEAAKCHILGTFAVMISGTERQPGQTAMKFARINALSDAPRNGCTVVGSKVLCGPMDAALANGMLAHPHAAAPSRPGCAIVPAALAAGELFAGDGVRFLRAVALGYEVAHTHGIASDFGAAAAAGCMAGLSAQQMRWLLLYASQQASATTTARSDADPIERSLALGGFPARNGVSAAVLAQLVPLSAPGAAREDQPGEICERMSNSTTWQEVVATSREKMTPLLGTQQTAELIEAVLHLESVTSIRDLRPLLQN